MSPRRVLGAVLAVAALAGAVAAARALAAAMREAESLLDSIACFDDDEEGDLPASYEAPAGKRRGC